MFPRIKFHRQTRWIGVPSNLLVPLVKSAFTLGLSPPPPHRPRSSARRLINISRDTLAPGFLTPRTTSARASRSVPDDTVFIERRLPRVWGNHDPWIAMPSYERLPVCGDIGRIPGCHGKFIEPSPNSYCSISNRDSRANSPTNWYVKRTKVTAILIPSRESFMRNKNEKYQFLI